MRDVTLRASVTLGNVRWKSALQRSNMKSNNHSPSLNGNACATGTEDQLLPDRPLRARSEQPYFYTARELARFLRVTETTIYRLAKRGELPSFAIGRSIRFRVQDVEAFIRRAKVEREDSG